MTTGLGGTVVPGEGASPAMPVAGRVLGVDPGLGRTGYAVLDLAARGGLVREAGIIRSDRTGKAGLGTRLATLHAGIVEVIEAFHPASLALEQVHSHPQHPRTAILMAHARGVIMLAAAQRGIPVVGYAPSRIKKTLTGSGRAPKEQMQRAVQLELRLATLPEPHDVADACAVALCHLQLERNRRGLAGI
jgi:crossover junction endodeoxyribonuclease RuvC